MVQGCRSQGVRGAAASPSHILADQLTLFKPWGDDYNHQITYYLPPDFQTFLRPCGAQLRDREQRGLPFKELLVEL